MQQHPSEHLIHLSSSSLRGRSSASMPRTGRDGGFTLIELMVVVLVIAILLAIAIPTFLGARERSQDRAAQSGLRNALSAAKVIYAEDGDYFAAANTTELEKIEPSLTYNRNITGSTGPDVISIDADQCSNGVDTTPANCTGTGTWADPACTGLTGRDNTSQVVCETPGTWSNDYSVWAAAAWSESETCFYIRDSAEALGVMSGTSYGSDDTIAAASCIGFQSQAVPPRA